MRIDVFAGVDANGEDNVVIENSKDCDEIVPSFVAIADSEGLPEGACGVVLDGIFWDNDLGRRTVRAS